MAKDEQDTPDVPEPYQGDVASQWLADRVARADAVEVLDFTAPEDGSQSVAFQPLHEGRVVRSAGRMVLGARAPTPTAPVTNDMRGALEPSQLFSSGKEGHRRSLSGGAAVVMACAVAVGSTAVLTNALNTSIERENGGVNAAFDAPASSAEGQPSASPTLTASSAAEPQATQLASLSPAAISQPAAVAEPGIVRVGRQDAPGLVIEDVSGESGAELPLRIEVGQSNTEDYSFLMFRGLPAEISLSAGFRLKDSWAVSLRDVANLALVSLPDYEARFQVEVLLIKGRNTPADSRVMTVSLTQSGPGTAPRTVASAPRQEAAPQRILTAAPSESKPLAEPKTEAPAPSLAAIQPKAEAPRPSLDAVQPKTEAPEPSLAAVQPKAEVPAPSLAAVRPKTEAPAPLLAPAQPKKLAISPETEAAMLNRAAKMLGLGDVSSARLLFEHIARKGSGKAAVALARTFDPAFFDSIRTRGLKPDQDKAKQWYAVAAELGEDDARSRLDVLSAR
jgi:hypothetical protein